MNNFDIRYSELTDESYLSEWLSDPETMQWFPCSDEKEKNLMVKNWIGFSKFKASLTGVMNNEPVAIGTLFFMPYKKVAHHCLFYLIVKKENRKSGIGSSMIKNLLHLAKNYFRLEIVHAEVYEDCSILSILSKQKFHCFAKQEKFVKTPDGYSARLLFERFL